MTHRISIILAAVSLLLGMGLGVVHGAPSETRFGVLEWRGYPEQYLWRIEWEPVAVLREGIWLAPGERRDAALDTVFAPTGMGAFIPEGWHASFWGCDTFDVAVGRWKPGTLPVDLGLEDPIPGTTVAAWARWPLEDPAQVWHGPGRPQDLAGALSGLTRDARAQIEKELPPGLEIDPDVPLARENLRLARGLEPETLELVGRMQGAVRLRGGGASSAVVLHFWVSAHAGERRFRFALLDLPRAGAARLSRRLIGVLESPESGKPLALLREETERGRRTVVLELLSSGVFRPLFESAWTGCGP
jgi:hypothetical protein